jgi:hypothetical protein
MMKNNLLSTQKVQLYLILTLIALHISVTCLLIWRYTVDDAFIFYRYARHLALGYGPVFNLNTLPVEGYSSPLWLLILGISYIFSEDIEFNSKVLGFMFNCASLLLLFSIARQHIFTQIKMQFLIFGLLWVALSPPFMISSVEGLETPALTFFTVLTTALVLQPKFNRGVLLGLIIAQAGMYFTRPDAALICLAVATLWLLALLPISHPNQRTRWQHLLSCYGALATLAFAHLLWRYGYYGYWFPATFYAKSGGTVAHLYYGIRRFSEFLHDTGTGILLVLQPFIWRLVWHDKQKVRLYIILSTLILMRVAFHLYSGGEIMGVHRFLTPTIPLIGLLWMWTLQEFDTALRFQAKFSKSINLGTNLALFIILFGLIGSNFPSIIRDRQSYRDIINDHEAVGQWLADTASDNWLVAAGDVGITFFVADNVDVLDLMGLNDYHIAQLPGKWVPRKASPKSDVSYVLAQKPEIIIFRGDPKQRAGQIIERDLADSQNFQEQYQFLYNEGWLHIYIHQALYNSIQPPSPSYELPDEVTN